MFFTEQFHIKDIRERYNLSQAEFADAIGLDRTYFCRVENGERKLPKRVLLKFEEIVDSLQWQEKVIYRAAMIEAIERWLA